MRRIFTALIFIFGCGVINGQIDGTLLLGLNKTTTAEMNAVTNPIEGSLLYNSDEKRVYQFNGINWQEIGTNTTDKSIYEIDGSLSTNRIIAMGTNNLEVTSTGGNFNVDGNTLVVDALDNKVGIRTNSPSVELDVNGKGRIRDIPMGADTDELLATDTDGNIRKVEQATPNKSYVQVYKENKIFGNGNATLLNLFPEVTIQAGKKVRIDIYVPTRDNTNSWGGLYVNVNAKVNGTWYNLGNTGYDGGVMSSSAVSIHALNHEMLLDFITNLNLPADQPFTLQFELTARSYNGSVYVNQIHDINRTANNLGSRGALQTWASDQNFCHIIIEEKNR